MHASGLVDLAALVAMHGPVIVARSSEIPKEGVDDYWSAAKSRLDVWNRSLRTLAGKLQDPHLSATQRDQLWFAEHATLEEILSGEVLTRTWTALARAVEADRSIKRAEPIARAVYIGHLEARHRALSLILAGQGLSAERAVQFNRLRRRVELWTDTLLAFLADGHEVDDFGFDAQRIREIADGLAHRRRRGDYRQSQSVLLGAIRVAFQQGLTRESPNQRLNAEIASGVLACFTPEIFDSLGQVKSPRHLQLEVAALDTLGMIEGLLAVESPADVNVLVQERRNFRPGNDPTHHEW